MEVNVHGHNSDISAVDRAAVEDRVAHAGRVFEQAVDKVDVELSEEPNPRRGEDRFRVELTASVAGRLVRIEAGAGSVDSALDDALERMTRQVRRLKGRLIDRNRQGGGSPDFLDEAEDVAHPEDALRQAIGVEWLQPIGPLARSQEGDGKAGRGPDAECRAAARVAIHLGKDQATDG